MRQVPVVRRTPGRPRSQSADHAILEATRTALAEEGWGGFSVEGVAARAGVAKTTIYRRFNSRADLAVAAVAELIAAALTQPGSSAAEDIRSAVTAVADVLGQPAARAAYLAVVAQSTMDPTLRATLDAHVIDPARQIVVDGLDRAVVRGELDADLAVERTDLLYDLLAGALVHRVLIRNAAADDDFLDALTAAALVALGITH